jgi:hypothetical protein
MANDKKFPGKILTMLYPSRSGLTSRSMPLGPSEFSEIDSYAELMNALQKAGPGCKIALKPTSEEYRSRKEAEMRAQGKKGGAATFILEVLSAAELTEERERMQANSNGEV